MLSSRPCATPAAALAATVLFATAGAVHAQSVKHESLTGWTHVGTAPNWTDDVPNTGAEFGKVDQLNFIDDLTYTSSPVTLQPGTYAAHCRLMKFQDANGAAPIDLIVILNGSPLKKVTLPVADQTVDQFVRTPLLTFSVLQPGSQATFLLVNQDTTITKLNYNFDSFQLGEIPDIGPVMHLESMGRTWSKSWGAPYFVGMVSDPDSIFAFAEELAYVWWLDWHRQGIVLEPGTYTANVRAKKFNGTGGVFDIDFSVVIAGQAQTVTWTIAEQAAAVESYVWTKDLVFDILQPSTPVTFKFENINTAWQKRSYRFDALAIRKGAYSTSGTSCPSSLGEVKLRGNPPQIGEPFKVVVENIPSGGFLLYGLTSRSLDLSVIGMTGCFLFTDPDASLGLTAQQGVASAEFLVPNNPALAGGVIYNQAVVFDPGQNPLGWVTSERGKGEISK